MREVLDLRDDILGNVFKSWIGIKEVARLDSALCERLFRIRFLSIIQKRRGDEDFIVDNDVDQYVRWRTLRHLPMRSTLFVGSSVSANFVENSQYYSAAVRQVQKLAVTEHGGNVLIWLELILPNCRNIVTVHASNMIVQDVRWLSILMRNNRLLTSVVLNSCESMTEDTFAEILNLPLLEHVQLDMNDTIAGTGTLNITTTTLQTFILRSFRALTTNNLRRIFLLYPLAAAS